MWLPGDVSEADGECDTECSDMTSKMVVGAVEASTDQRDGVLGKQHNRDPGHCGPQPAATAEYRWTGSFGDRSDQVGNRICGSKSELPTQRSVLRCHGRA